MNSNEISRMEVTQKVNEWSRRQDKKRKIKDICTVVVSTTVGLAIVVYTNKLLGI